MTRRVATMTYRELSSLVSRPVMRPRGHWRSSCGIRSSRKSLSKWMPSSAVLVTSARSGRERSIGTWVTDTLWSVVQAARLESRRSKRGKSEKARGVNDMAGVGPSVDDAEAANGDVLAADGVVVGGLAQAHQPRDASRGA